MGCDAINRADWSQYQARLSSAMATSQIPRQQDRQDVQRSHQQLCHAGTNRRRSLSLSLSLHVELFFKWIKQHLSIKSFLGTSENAVKSQIWIALSIYVLVAIIKKRPDLKADLYTILQVLSLTLFEKIPLNQLLTDKRYNEAAYAMCNQLNVFDNLTGQ